jgi:acetyl esterase/lipase
VILLYGNSFTEGYASRSQLNSAAADLAAHGYVAFNVDYRLLTSKAGENSWPGQLDDVQRAVRWIRANAATYGVDPERVASYGLSSGGLLAAMLGVRETRDNSVEALAQYSSRVNGAVSVVGVYDLSIPFALEDDNRVVRNLLGGTIAEVPAAYRDASPIEWVDGDSAPFLILHSGDDPEDSPDAPRAMAAALQRAVVDVAYIENQQTNHFSWTTWSLPAPWTLTFFQGLLRPDE